MRDKEQYSRCRRDYVRRHRDLHPGLSTGFFFIVVGLVLLAAFNDVLHFGSINDYFKWQLIMIYVGTLLLLNLKFVGGIIMISLGGWFLLDELGIILPPMVHNVYWPAIIVVIGIVFIISSFFRRNREIDNLN
jgi:hypothetical protein